MATTVAGSQTCDVAVVGGGILGLAIAALTAQRGYSVSVFRMNDRGRPRADTLRNQGWLQSGLMYVGHFDGDRKRGRTLAAKMYAAGVRMLRDLGLPVPDGSEFGFYRVRNDDEAARLEEDARELRLANVRPLDLETVRRSLGPVFEEGIFYSIPDVPFPEGEVLNRLRSIAGQEGANFVQVDSPIRLVRNEQSESGVCVRHGDLTVYPRVTIASAGAGNFDLLRGLEIPLAVDFQQTPLLVVNDSLSISAPIFADKPRGFSFVRHPPEGHALPRGALVVGTRVARTVLFASPDERRIDQEDIESFASHLPPALSDYIQKGRFTAGYEVIPRQKERKHIEPWVEWLPDFRGLLLAMPGRATMGMAVARQVLADLESRLGRPARGSSNGTTQGSWDDDIFMHFHPYYDFNDWQQPQGGN